jgi:hypothetical protein
LIPRHSVTLDPPAPKGVCGSESTITVDRCHPHSGGTDPRSWASLRSQAAGRRRASGNPPNGTQPGPPRDRRPPGGTVPGGGAAAAIPRPRGAAGPSDRAILRRVTTANARSAAGGSGGSSPREDTDTVLWPGPIDPPLLLSYPERCAVSSCVPSWPPGQQVR